MKKNELNFTPKIASLTTSITKPNNNSIKDEISQIFNKVYDRNFLSFINELSISILKFHKSFDNQSNIFKNLLNEIDKQNNENKIENIKNSFNQIEILINKFYSESKVIFKKMKLYRSNIIKSNNKPELNFRHKKSVSINFDIEKNNKITDLNDDFKYNKNSVINRDKICLKDNILNTPKIKNYNNDNSQNDKINLSNYESNKSSNTSTSNIINQVVDKNEPEENKNQNNIIAINYLNNLLLNIKSFDTSINFNSIDKDKISKINKYYEDKKNNLINFVNNIINDLKKDDKNLNIINENKDKMNNLLNKINILEIENNKIKQQFEKYKADEKIKKKFMETQIMTLSKKDLENSRNMKLKEKEFKEKKSEYEENIFQLKTNIINIEKKVNEKQEINKELQNEINKIKENYEKLLIENEQKNKNENNLKNIIANKDKEISQINDKNKKLSDDLNEKETKIKEMLLKYDEMVKNKELEEKEIKLNKELINQLEIKNNLLNKKNINNENKKDLLENKINDYENEIKIQKEEINKQIEKNKNLNNNYTELNKDFNKIKEEISEKEKMNLECSETILKLKEENKILNDLLIENKNKIIDDKNKFNTKINECKKEISNLNNELDDKNKIINNINEKIEEKNEIIEEYKNKYENELNKNNKLETKIKEYNNLKEKEEEENINEYENKKRKIPIGRNRINNNEIENIEKKFRYLYRTMENFNSKSKHNEKSNNNSTISNDRNNIKENYDSNIVRKNTYTNLNNLDKNNEINNKEDKNEKINVSPDNYSFVKCYNLNNKLKWCLFKKKEKLKKHKSLIFQSQNKSHFRKYSFGKESTTITNITNTSKNYEAEPIDYNDYIWLPYKTNKDFIEFGDISSLNESSFSISEKGEEISKYKSIIKKLENKIMEKENEYNKMDKFCFKLMQENKNFKNNTEKLIKENIDLNNEILKYKSDIKKDNNFIGVSFIDEDPESSKFIDDKCCEDILNGLNKEKDKDKKINCYTNNLKNCIDMLMTKVVPSENVRSLLASILRQLGCTDQDIFKLLGNYRGVISIPFSYNKFYNK